MSTIVNEAEARRVLGMVNAIEDTANRAFAALRRENDALREKNDELRRELELLRRREMA